MCQRPLQLQHGTRELVTETCLAAVVVGRCGTGGCCSIAMSTVTVVTMCGMCGMCVGVGGGCSLDSARSRIASLETGHQRWFAGASDSSMATAVKHFDLVEMDRRILK
jgi:hypothetical protein